MKIHVLLGLFICLLIGGFSISSCINNDIPYPVIPMQITAFEVDGQLGTAAIDNSTRTVTVTLADTVNLKKVLVKHCSVTEGITSPVDSADVLDLSSPQKFILSLYQDYEWTIKAEQTIERVFSVKKQFGKAVFNTTLHQAMVYISPKASQRAVEIKELRLGPTEITTMEPQLEGTVDFSLPKKVTVKYHDIVEEWTVMVSQTDKTVATGEADAWVNVAWLHGTGEEGMSNAFEYKETSASTWTKVPEKDITMVDGEMIACISGLKAQTSYTFRVSSGEDYGDEVEFTTEIAVSLPGGTFDEWYKEGKVWNPWAEGGTPIWDTGNDGATTLGESNTQPTDDTWNGKGQAGRLESKFVGIGSIGKFAAGNLFIGNFVGVDGTNGILDLGRPFTARPTKLRGHYKYSTAPIKYTVSGFEHLKELPDTCSIYVAIGDWPEPVRIQTKPSDLKVFDKNNQHVIAYAEFNSGTTVTEYKDFELTLDYRYTNRIPTYIIVVCSASKFGDYFVGGAGSVLYVDDFTLEYDY